MAAYDLKTVLDNAGNEKPVFGGGPPNWEGKGRVYDFLTPEIDCKAYNDSVPAAQQLKAGDQIDLMELRNDTLIMAYAVNLGTTAGAACDGQLRFESDNVGAAVDLNGLSGTTTTAQLATPVRVSAPAGGTATLNMHLSAAPGDASFRVWMQFADLSADR